MTESNPTKNEKDTAGTGQAPVTVEPLTEPDDRRHEACTFKSPPAPSDKHVDHAARTHPPLGSQPPESPINENARSNGWSADQVVQAIKELVTAILALVLVGYTVFVVDTTLGYVGDAQKMTEAKDVLLLMLGLAGIVIGYYFGRIPGDAQATQARKQATAATTQTEQVSAQAQEIAERVSGLTRRLAAAPALRRDSAGGLDPSLASDLDELQSSVTQLSRLARARFD